MRVGLAALGIGPGATPAVVRAVATSAETAGFASLWAGEHVVLVDRPKSRYPYADDGRLAVPATADWLDPLIALSVAAAVTRTIRLATGVLLLPEHNPVLVAKQAASLDRLSGGRLVLGVGIGWSAEEFAAVGVPFARRAARTADYVAAMRRLWSDDLASYRGEFVSFDAVRCYPKPHRGRVPIIVGGNSDQALARAARWGDGWYGFNVTVAETAGRVQTLRRLCSQRSRDPSGVEIVVAPFTRPVDRADLTALAPIRRAVGGRVDRRTWPVLGRRPDLAVHQLAAEHAYTLAPANWQVTITFRAQVRAAAMPYIESDHRSRRLDARSCSAATTRPRCCLTSQKPRAT